MPTRIASAYRRVKRSHLHNRSPTQVSEKKVIAKYGNGGERAACLTRAAGPGNLAAYMQFIPLLGDVEQGIVQVQGQDRAVAKRAMHRG